MAERASPASGDEPTIRDVNNEHPNATPVRVTRAEDLPPRFAVARADEPLVQVVVVAGELDMSTAPRFASELASLDSARPVVIDLCDTAFMDSSGLRVLLAAQDDHDGRFLVACEPTGPVHRVIDVSAVQLLQVFPDRSSAVAAAVT
jgi:anti-anti-sigma factor